MHAAIIRVWFVAGVVLLTFGGCTQTQSTSSPGAMPDDFGDVADSRIRPTTYFAHGHLLERQGSFERAAEQYRHALAVLPDFVTARTRLGITLNKLGKHAEASAAFRRAIAAKPQLAHLHNNLGFSLYLEGKYTEAEAATRRALEIRPSFARARMNRALALAKLGRFEEVFGELRQVGSEADAHYNLALLQTEARKYADAARSLDMALRLNPNLEAARQQLREISVLAARQETVPVADVTTAPEPAPAPEPLVAAEASEPAPDGDTTMGDEVLVAEAVEVALELAARAEPTGPSLDNLFRETNEPGWGAAPRSPDATLDGADQRADTAGLAEPAPQGDAQTPIEKIRALISAILGGSQERIAQLWCELEASLESAEE